jgi:cytidylate kinase
MSARKRSIEQLVDEQVKKWGFEHRGKPSETPAVTMVTVSRDPGSGGKLIAQGLAEELKFDMFHQNVIHEMAESARVSSRVLESLDEKGLSMLEDWISSVVYQKHLWPDEYLQHLMKVIGTIGKHGRAVIVGRGANFILPGNSTFRLRVSAPRDFRAQKVAQEFDLPLQEAHNRILKTESDRKAFIRKYFHSDISNADNYDMVINTGSISLREAIETVAGLLRPKT